MFCFPKWIEQTIVRTVYGIHYQNFDNKVPNATLLMSVFQKRNLYMLYGKNHASDKKIAVVENLRKGKDFQFIAREMQVALATAEVYAIDSFAANAPLDENVLARHLQVDSDAFEAIRAAIVKNTDRKLRSVKDELKDAFSYNQIRFVIACLIRDIEI